MNFHQIRKINYLGDLKLYFLGQKNRDKLKMKMATKSVSSYHSTNCEFCFRTCHEDCQLNETNVKGDKSLQNCAIMEKCPVKGFFGLIKAVFLHSFEFQCKECGCNLSHHFHSKTIYNFGDTKQKYEVILKKDFKNESLLKIKK